MVYQDWSNTVGSLINDPTGECISISVSLQFDSGEQCVMMNDNTDTQVMCRQLGYSSYAHFINTFF